MVLKNKTTGKVICRDLKICHSFVDRMFGLLITENPVNLLFKTRFGIHTFFLKEPIDVLILDGKLRVVKLMQNLRPNSLFFWNPKYKNILEIKKGTIRKFKIKPNQILDIC